ncbi:uncharacterized protein METZ01_LOCUS228146, partial [marine metagenome]
VKNKTIQSAAGGARPLLYLVSGIVVVLTGLIGSSFGSVWSGQVYELFAGIQIMEYIEMYVPYFPFVPFLPIFTITLGAFLILKSKE